MRHRTSTADRATSRMVVRQPAVRRAAGRQLQEAAPVWQLAETPALAAALLAPPGERTPAETPRRTVARAATTKPALRLRVATKERAERVVRLRRAARLRRGARATRAVQRIPAVTPRPRFL